MTYEELKKVAERRGVIRWLTSRKIEFLSMEGDNIMAYRMLPRRSHIINQCPNYACVEMASVARVVLSDLDWTVENQLPAMGGRGR